MTEKTAQRLVVIVEANAKRAMVCVGPDSRGLWALLFSVMRSRVAGIVHEEISWGRGGWGGGGGGGEVCAPKIPRTPLNNAWWVGALVRSI